jgi:ATP-dependent helicase HrpB
VLTAWREEQGDILAFLPGVGEIERVRERLAEKLPQVPILPLHGQVEPQDQRAAIRRDPQGRRRIVLATAIAETSLTLDGVSVVVDSGLSRRASSTAGGGTHLVTRRASQASGSAAGGPCGAAGAGRRLSLVGRGGPRWAGGFPPPKCSPADLAPLLLRLAQVGRRPIRPALPWLDPPPEVRHWPRAKARCGRWARWMKPAGSPRRAGRSPALPMEPMAGSHGAVWRAARLRRGGGAAGLLLQERGLGGRGEDLLAAAAPAGAVTGRRADAPRKLARWLGRAGGWPARAAK